MSRPPSPWVRTGIAAVLALAIGAAIGHWGTSRATDPPSTAAASSGGSESGPVADVQAVPLTRKRIAASLVAYGAVIAAPSDTRTFSVPYETRVKRILVTPGQVIAHDTALLEVEPSSETHLQLDEARNQRDLAQQALDMVKQREELKLATRQEVLQAQQQLDTATLRVHSFESRGVQDSRVLRASAPGVVSEIAVQPGQIVAAGAPLLDTIGENQIVVRLGIESQDAFRVRADQPVTLRAVAAPANQTTAGKVRLVASRVNPQTRLVDVYVTPDPAAHLLLNEYVQGTIEVAAHDAWVVPREAVLPADGRLILYTIERDHAVRHVVTLGLENDREVEVIDESLKDGQPVVVVGNSQLEPNMAVHTGPRRVP